MNHKHYRRMLEDSVDEEIIKSSKKDSKEEPKSGIELPKPHPKDPILGPGSKSSVSTPDYERKVREYLEYKKKKLAASEMEKGAARRLYGKFDPVKLPSREKVKEWQTSTGQIQELDSSYDDSMHQYARESIPEMQDAARLRALNKLSSQTLSRKHPETGERQFLLFRGIGEDEMPSVNPKHIRSDVKSSWTPHLHVARGFEDSETGKTVAAWVNEKDIHSAPHMYGNIPDLKMDMDMAGEFYVPDSRKKGKSEFSFEHEIIVGPHTSMRATKADVKRHQAFHKDTRTSISNTDPKKDLDARINYRGRREKEGFKSTKAYPLARETRPLPSSALEAVGLKKPKKLAASEQFKNQDDLIHYSSQKGLKILDPAKMGTGVSGHQVKRGIPENKSVFFYTAESEPESIVATPDKTKYRARIRPGHKVYDLESDPANLMSEFKKQNQGIWNEDAFHGYLKDKGFHGIRWKMRDNTSVVQMYHPMEVEEVYKSIKLSIFETFEDLEKSEAPKYEGHIDEVKNRVGKLHPNGILMWHQTPQTAEKHDSIINNPKHLDTFLSKIPDTHKNLMRGIIKHVASDPNRHFIPTEEGGRNKLRARHIKDLILGNKDINIDTSDPNTIKISRLSHSQGQNIGRTISFEFSQKRKA